MLCAPTRLLRRVIAAMNPAHRSETSGESDGLVIIVAGADDVVSCMHPVCNHFVACELDLLYGRGYTHEGSKPVQQDVDVTYQ